MIVRFECFANELMNGRGVFKGLLFGDTIFDSQMPKIYFFFKFEMPQI